MRANSKVSTTFSIDQRAHRVSVLTTIAGDRPLERAPINLAMVLDRSGSMSGPPLAAAKHAAKRFVQFLAPTDRIAVVVFDNNVDTIFGPRPVDHPKVEEAIGRIHAGGSTNLSGGWLKGQEHVASGLVKGVNRVLLFTDGCANAGIKDPDKLLGLSRGALTNSLTTTCIGFGAHFNEDLMRGMADAGGGNYWYIQDHDQMGEVFDEEIEGLVSLVAQNLEIEVSLRDKHVVGVSFPQGYPVSKTGEQQFRAIIGDLYATMPRELAVSFLVEDIEDLGETKLGEVIVKSDCITDDGVEQRVTKLPVMANLDRNDHVIPEVEKTFLRFEAAKAQDEAVKKADEGDIVEAMAILNVARERMVQYGRDPEIAEEIEELLNQAEQFELGGHLSELERKRRKMRSYASMTSKEMYLRKMQARRQLEERLEEERRKRGEAS
jgi:Ca-activated chloride channel family protein